MRALDRLVVALALPLFLGGHCHKINCETADRTPLAASSASARPIALTPGQVVELLVATGIEISLSSRDDVIVQRGIAGSAACGDAASNASLVRGGASATFAPAEPREPLGFTPKNAKAPPAMVDGERFWLRTTGAATTVLLSYRGTRPPVYANEEMHGGCVEVPYDPVSEDDVICSP